MILAGDIGGTHARLAFFDVINGRFSLVSASWIRASRYDSTSFVIAESRMSFICVTRSPAPGAAISATDSVAPIVASELWVRITTDKVMGLVRPSAGLCPASLLWRPSKRPAIDSKS